MQHSTDDRINWRDLDISAITDIDECQAFILRVTQARDSVAETIQRRQDDKAAGEEIDLGHFRRMQAALKGLGRTHQALNMHLGKLGRDERKQRAEQGRQLDAQKGRTFAQHFLAVVRESVDDEVYQDWCRAAEQRVTAQG